MLCHVFTCRGGHGGMTYTVKTNKHLQDSDVMMSERHNQARDIYRKTLKYVLSIIYTPAKKTWNPQMKDRKMHLLFKEWLSGSMLVFGGVVGVFPHCCETYAPLCWVSFLPKSSKLVRGDDFKGKYPTTNHIPEEPARCKIFIEPMVVPKLLEKLDFQKEVVDICRYPHPNSSYP